MADSKQEVVNAEIGQLIDISLDSRAGSTGYSWKLAFLDGIELVDMSIVQTSSQIGALETQIFKFHCSQVGTGKVKFVLTAVWKQDPPIKEFEFEIQVGEAKKADEDSLKLAGFVSLPKATVGSPVTALYNVLPSAGFDARLYYGVFPPLGMDPRVYYGVFPPIGGGDPRVYYGVCPSQSSGDPRVYYGVFPSQSSGDPRLYYGVCPSQSNGDPRFYYGVLPAYNVSPPVYKYGVLPGTDNSAYRMTRPYDVCPPNNSCC
jgi:hypothetical protein